MATFVHTGIHNFQPLNIDATFYRRHGYTKAPVIIQCYLTLRCDLACPHCLIAHDDSPSSDMPLHLFSRLCEEARSIGVQELLLTGGEPLLRRDFSEIVECLKRHGLTWSLNTAVCPDEEQQGAISAYPPAFVAVSLDGPAHVHNAFRGSTSAFADAASAVRFFSAVAGTTVCAGTTVSTLNIRHLDETLALVKKSGAHKWGIHLLIPEGRARERMDLFPTMRQMRRLLEFIAVKRHEFPMSLADEMGHAGGWESLVRDGPFFCAAGRAMCAVLPDGSVMPCSTRDPKHCEGSLVQNTLADIWRTGFGKQRAQQPYGKCARCKDWSICRSGCWLQREHGTQCFRTLWEVPASLKAAAGICLSLGLAPAGAVYAQDSVTKTDSLLVQTTNASGSGNSAIIAAPRFMGVLYGSKAGGGSHRRLSCVPAIKAMRWLKAHQESDGSWSAANEPEAYTGLALLCFLHGNHTPASREFGISVEKALRYLLGTQNDNGAFSASAESHAIVTHALADAYARTKMVLLRPPLEKAVDRILNHQRNGSWSIDYATNGGWNLSVSAWQIQALKTAELAGLAGHSLSNGLEQAADFVQKTAFKDGAFRDSSALADQEQTRCDVQGAGARCLQWLGRGKSAEAQSAIAVILKNPKSFWNDERESSSRGTNGIPCGWFFQVQAIQGSTNAPMKEWNRQLVQVQCADGHWECGEPAARANSTAQGLGYVNPLYSTMMNCLMIEIFHGRVTTFKRVSPTGRVKE